MEFSKGSLEHHAATADSLIVVGIAVSAVGCAAFGAVAGYAVFHESGVGAMAGAVLVGGVGLVVASTGAAFGRMVIHACLAAGETAHHARESARSSAGLLSQARAGVVPSAPTKTAVKPKPATMSLEVAAAFGDSPPAKPKKLDPQHFCSDCGGELVAGECSNVCGA